MSNMQTPILLLLAPTDEILPPVPPTGKVFWADNSGDLMVDNTGAFFIFNAG